MFDFHSWMMGRELREATAPTWDTIWKYLRVIQGNPNLDDLKTLGNLYLKLVSSEPDPRRSFAMFADLWGSIKHDIIPALPPQEGQQALSFFANLKTNLPQYTRSMQQQGLRNFTSLDEFEDFIVSGMKQDASPEGIMSVVQSPNNAHYWDALDVEVKKELVAWMKEKQAERAAQPSLGDIIHKHIRGHQEPGT